MVRIAALIASFYDPTGVSSVLASYVYPNCDKVSLWCMMIK